MDHPVFAIRVPGGCTGISQLTDVGLAQPTKAAHRLYTLILSWTGGQPKHTHQTQPLWKTLGETIETPWKTLSSRPLLQIAWICSPPGFAYGQQGVRNLSQLVICIFLGDVSKGFWFGLVFRGFRRFYHIFHFLRNFTFMMRFFCLVSGDVSCFKMGLTLRWAFSTRSFGWLFPCRKSMARG